MMAVVLLALIVLALVLAPCLIGRYIRASLYTVPSGTATKPSLLK